MDISAQLTLQTWMSAAFPTGAFTCSHGIETAIVDGRINNASSCQNWIADIIEFGSGWNDAVLIAHAYATVLNNAPKGRHLTASETGCKPDYQALRQSLNELNDLACALCAGNERLRELTQLGDAFAKSSKSYSSEALCAKDLVDGSICLPIAVGAQGALSNIPLEQLLPANVQALSSNLVWIATRFIPLGQTQALDIIRNLQPIVVSLAKQALSSTLDDLGSSTLLADLASLEHELLHSRICIT